MILRKVLIGVIGMLISYPTLSQTIEEKKTDDFTGSKIIRTSEENLLRENGMFSYVRVSSINNETVLNYRFMITGKIVTINKGNALLLKLKNEKVVTLRLDDYVVAGYGNGAVGVLGSDAPGANLRFVLDSDQISMLKSSPIAKVRLYTDDGYIDSDVKKEKWSSNIQRLLELIEE
ncbi:hypothetical protein GCM10011506_46040 [Marivirga lumbricoides]|uniref:DUF4369 domain-containing protein n=1 Tax=Marivirga lumbricoides TaxID=1046115 RepID=A0ABQ1ND71_9BACT|nr:hypothetical protein GCM10011506_46040 [Marivirga lumbricoides]